MIEVCKEVWESESYLESRGGNRPGHALKGMSLTYEFFYKPQSGLLAYHRPFFLARADLFKSLDWPESLLTGLLYIKVIK